MTAMRNKANVIAEAVFDRIEYDGRCIRQTIEQVIYDGLLLAQAKEIEEGGRGGVDTGDDAIRAEAVSLIRFIINNPRISMDTPNELLRRLATLRETIQIAGYRVF